MAVRSDTLQVKIAVDGEGRAKASLAGLGQSIQDVQGKARGGISALSLMSEAAKGAIGALSAGAAITWMVQSIAQAERLAAQLRSVTGSQSEANRVLAMSQQLAFRSANSADQLTAAYITLANRGLRPTQDTMLSLANVAAGTGRTVEEVADSVAAALGGQYRSLEQLGIKVDDTGGVLTGTFRGVTTVIGSSSAEIVEYLRQIGENDFGHAAAREAETLAGRWVQLKQAADDLAEGLADSGLLALLVNITEAAADLSRTVGELMERLRNGDSRALLALTNPLALGFQAGARRPLEESREQEGPSLRDQGAAALDRVLEKWREIRVAVNEKTQAEEESSRKANESGQRVLESLERQRMALELGEGAAVRHAAAEAAAKVANKELADQIIATGNAIAAQIEKKEADQKATTASAAAERAAAKEQRENEKARAKALKELNDLQDAHAEGLQHLHSVMDEEEDIQRRLKDAYAAVLDIIDPYGREVRDLEREYDDLVAAQKEAAAAGLLTKESAEEQAKALALLREEIDKAAEAADKARARGKLVDWLSGSLGSEEAAGEFLDRLMDDVAQTFTKSLKSGFKDASSDFGEMLDDLADQILNQIIRDKIVGNMMNAAGGGNFDGAAFAGGAATVGGAWAGGAIGGGGQRATSYAATGAAMGAVVGSIIPVIGTIVGAIIGGIIGGLAGGVLDSRSTAKIFSGSYSGDAFSTGYSAFGQVNAYTYGMGKEAESQLLQAAINLDNAIAKLLTLEEVAAVREALDHQLAQAKTPEATLAERLNLIIETVEPRWVEFLNKFQDLEGKAAAFGALRNIETQVQDFDRVLAMVADPVQQMRMQLEELDEAVTDTAANLAAAIAAQDPVKIEQAASASVDAIVNRYNTEIQLAQTLEAALASAKQQAYQLQLTIAQRIAGITGSNLGVIGLTAGRIGELQGAIPGMEPGAGMGALSEYLGAVDTWLAAGQSDIQQWLDGQLAALQQRAAAEDAAAQRAAQRAQALHQQQIAALQRQLELAQQWIGVLEQAKQFQDSLQFGESNPLGGFGQLDSLNQAIQQLLGPASAGTDRGLEHLDADSATRLLDLLQQRIALIQSQDLMQRPSGEYLDQYNQTLALIDQVRDLAQPEVDRAEELQLQIIDLQAQTVGAVSSGSSNIAAQQAALRREAQERLDRLNEQALDYYTWAQEQGQELEDERVADLLAQLYELTGGLPVQDFIALKQHEATLLLTDIRDNLRDFLQAIATGSLDPVETGPGNGHSTRPLPDDLVGGGANAAAGTMAAPPGINVQVVINGAGMSRDEVVRTFHQEVRHAASDIKRMLAVA